MCLSIVLQGGQTPTEWTMRSSEVWNASLSDKEPSFDGRQDEFAPARAHIASRALHMFTDPTRIMFLALSHHNHLLSAITFYQHARG